MHRSPPTRAPTWFSARRLFEQKLSELHKCTDLTQLNQIHAIIYRSNLHGDPLIATKLVSAFSLCRQIDSAVKVFHQIHEPHLHLYNAYIRAQIRDSQFFRAFATFSEMQNYGVSPDTSTYSFLLKACSAQSWLKVVAMLHARILNYGLCDYPVLMNSLIDSYSKCGLTGFCFARKLFNSMEGRDAVTYNSMISGSLKVGELEEARKVFDEMPERDMVSWNTILDGYVKAGEMNMALELFENMPSRDSVTWSTMVSGYNRLGNLNMSRVFFEQMPVKNPVAWTIIICAYAAKGLTKEAESLYHRMVVAGMGSDEGTIVSILAACSASGMLCLGKRVHNSLGRCRYTCSTRISNALIDMYAKCGNLKNSLILFNEMKRKNLVSWNTMIHGLAMHGHGESALQLFCEMKQKGFAPDRVTFVGVLSACNHAGLVDAGTHYFYTMEKDYGVILEIEHYGCMIDLLGRGGHLKEAFRLIQSMPIEPNEQIWGALLGACRKHYTVAFVEEEFKHLAQLDLKDSGNLSMLSNIYAAAGEWANYATARLQMRNTGCGKPSAGASSVEVDDEFHEFSAGDQCHPKSDIIYEMINGLTQHVMKLGNVPLLSF